MVLFGHTLLTDNQSRVDRTNRRHSQRKTVQVSTKLQALRIDTRYFWLTWLYWTLLALECSFPLSVDWYWYWLMMIMQYVNSLVVVPCSPFIRCSSKTTTTPTTRKPKLFGLHVEAYVSNVPQYNSGPWISTRRRPHAGQVSAAMSQKSGAPSEK
jgi:hypothetical protein